MPSQAELEQHQRDVQELSALAVAEIAVLVMAVAGDEEDSLVTAIPTALNRYMGSATLLAANWYRGLAREQPRVPERKPGAPEPIVGPTDRVSLLDALDFEPRPAELPPREQLESTVWWALSSPSEAEPRVTEDLAPEDMSSDELVDEVRRLRGMAEPDIDVTEPESEPEPESESDQQEPESAPSSRARVLPPDGSAQAQIIPAEASERQAQVISRLAGATQRYVTSAARNTVTSNATREGVRWVRHAQPDACAFCRMLATRGHLDGGYLTKESAKRVVGRNGKPRGKRKLGELYHDVCGCEPVPVRAGDSYEPPEYVTDWSDQYYLAVDEVGNAYDTTAILAAMREMEAARGGSTH